MPAPSLYWYDYETFGVDPRRDRPAQFGGLRTDYDLNYLSEPLAFYCKPPRDYLPAPEACFITGITPQRALRDGLPEAEFISRIHEQFSVPGTCVAGFNNLRFDDEVTRHCLYRNLFDPYAREWRNGNSRWDIIDMLRLTRALRPEGMEWPKDASGRFTFKLDRLTAANGISHDNAHDALADVEATIAVARLVKARQPKLYQFVFAHRGKREAADLLRLGAMLPVIHASEKYSAERHCVAVVVALAGHPQNPNGVVVYDLSVDPTPLLTLSPEDLHRRLFTPVNDLPPGAERVPLKTVHLNKCPVIAPIGALRPEDAERLDIDLGRCYRHLEQLKNEPGLAEKVREILTVGADGISGAVTRDPDLMLYDGGFIGDGDRRILERLRSLPLRQLAEAHPVFQDARLPELLFRYRARNYPETLSAEEAARWEAFRLKRLTEPGFGGAIVLKDFEEKLRNLEADASLTAGQRDIVESLWRYVRELVTHHFA
jgi:exodeoxyribonuclease-1